MRTLLLSTLLAVGLIGSASAQDATTDTFGTGDNQFTLDFTTIGNAGQQGVAYNYRIGTYAISQNQINAAIASGLMGVNQGSWSGDQPSTLSWCQAATFVNWLNTSTGFLPAYNLTSSSYLWTATDSGYDPNNPYRSSAAKYFMPSDSEYYKAAFGKSDGSGFTLYATASDTPPIAVASGTDAGTAVYGTIAFQPASVYQSGGLSAYGTMGQVGNVWEWIDTLSTREVWLGDGLTLVFDGTNIVGATPITDAEVLTFAGVRGTTFFDFGIIGGYKGYVMSNISGGGGEIIPTFDGIGNIGFRVASVIPEPSTYALFGIGAIGMLMVLRRKKAV
jgi:hypothetical protein